MNCATSFTTLFLLYSEDIIETGSCSQPRCWVFHGRSFDWDLRNHYDFSCTSMACTSLHLHFRSDFQCRWIACFVSILQYMSFISNREIFRQYSCTLSFVFDRSCNCPSQSTKNSYWWKLNFHYRYIHIYYGRLLFLKNISTWLRWAWWWWNEAHGGWWWG